MNEEAWDIEDALSFCAAGDDPAELMLVQEVRRLRAENEAMRYLLDGIAPPASIEAAIKHTQAAIAPRRRGE